MTDEQRAAWVEFQDACTDLRAQEQRFKDAQLRYSRAVSQLSTLAVRPDGLVERSATLNE